MKTLNSHYQVEGLEICQPSTLSAILNLEGNFFSLYKYLFRMGRKEGEHLGKEVQKSLDFCDNIVNLSLHYNFQYYEDGSFISKNEDKESELQEYLVVWKDKMKYHKEFKDNKAMQYFINTIVGYYYYYTNKKVLLIMVDTLDLDLSAGGNTTGTEFLKQRIENLKNIIKNSINQ